MDMTSARMVDIAANHSFAAPARYVPAISTILADVMSFRPRRKMLSSIKNVFFLSMHFTRMYHAMRSFANGVFRPTETIPDVGTTKSCGSAAFQR